MLAFIPFIALFAFQAASAYAAPDSDSGGTKLCAAVEALKVQAATANFKNAAELLKKAEKIEAFGNSSGASDEKLLKIAVDAYTESFGLLTRIFSSAPKECWDEAIAPINATVEKRTSCLSTLRSLKRELLVLSSPVEDKFNFGKGTCGVYNPETGLVEWKTTLFSKSLAGVYNRATKQVEWKESAFANVAGAYNEKTKTVEWRENVFGKPFGVYNPSRGEVEWESVIFSKSIGGVHNPSTGKVEWDTSIFPYHGGAYNPATQKAEWNYSSLAPLGGVYDPSSKEVRWHSALIPDTAMVIKGAPFQSFNCFFAEPEKKKKL